MNLYHYSNIILASPIHLPELMFVDEHQPKLVFRLTNIKPTAVSYAQELAQTLSLPDLLEELLPERDLVGHVYAGLDAGAAGALHVHAGCLQ